MNASQNGPLGNGSPRRERRNFTAQQKVAIVKRHLVDGMPVSDLCDEHQLAAFNLPNNTTSMRPVAISISRSS